MIIICSRLAKFYEVQFSFYKDFLGQLILTIKNLQFLCQWQVFRETCNSLLVLHWLLHPAPRQLTKQLGMFATLIILLKRFKVYKGLKSISQIVGSNPIVPAGLLPFSKSASTSSGILILLIIIVSWVFAEVHVEKGPYTTYGAQLIPSASLRNIKRFNFSFFCLNKNHQNPSAAVFSSSSLRAAVMALCLVASSLHKPSHQHSLLHNLNHHQRKKPVSLHSTEKPLRTVIRE